MTIPIDDTNNKLRSVMIRTERSFQVNQPLFFSVDEEDPPTIIIDNGSYMLEAGSEVSVHEQGSHH